MESRLEGGVGVSFDSRGVEYIGVGVVATAESELDF